MRNLCLLVISLLATVCCSADDDNKACGPCPSPAVHISVQSAADSVQTLTTSGTACSAEVIITSTFANDAGTSDVNSGFAPGATHYSIRIRAATGQCLVQVVTNNGQQLQKTFTVSRNQGCCETYSVDSDTWDLDS